MDARTPLRRSAALRRLGPLVAVGLLVSGCAWHPGAGVPAGRAPHPLVGTWADELGARLEFGSDGTLRGTDGCNDLTTGRWQAVGDDGLRLEYGMTERRCVRAPSLALDARMTWQRTDGTLVLMTGGGSESTLARRPPG